MKETYDVATDFERDLRDPEYAREYGAAQAKAEFAIALSLARQAAGLTQKELAERIGKKQSYIAQLESETANPTLSTAGAVLAATGSRMVIRTEPISLCGTGESRNSREVREVVSVREERVQYRSSKATQEPDRKLGRQKAEFGYTVSIRKAPDGTYIASCPVISEAHAQGKTYEECLANMKEALESSLEFRKGRGEEIPEEIETEKVTVVV